MSIGIWQVVLILLIVLILFGAGKLPKVMGDLAKGVKSFKAGLKDEDEAAPAPPITAQRSDAAAAAAPPEVKKDEPAKS